MNMSQTLGSQLHRQKSSAHYGYGKAKNAVEVKYLYICNATHVVNGWRRQMSTGVSSGHLRYPCTYSGLVCRTIIVGSLLR